MDVAQSLITLQETFPHAVLDTDNEGQNIVYTGLYEGQETTLDQSLVSIQKVFPLADVDYDNDRQVVIYTNTYEKV